MGFFVVFMCALAVAQVLEVTSVSDPTYVQLSAVAHVPCPGLTPDSPVSLLYWYKGASLNPARDRLLLRSGRTTDDSYTISSRYGVTTGYALTIAAVNATDTDTYWCRVIWVDNGDMHVASVKLVVVTPREPSIDVCSSLPSSSDGVCEVKASRQLILTCQVQDVLPPPAVSWEVIRCDDYGNANSSRPPPWFSSEQRSVGDSSYDVSRKVYLGALELSEGALCSFACRAEGVGIVEESASMTVNVRGQRPDTGGECVTSDRRAGLKAGVVFFTLIALACLVVIIILAKKLRDQTLKTRQPNGSKQAVPLLSGPTKNIPMKFASEEDRALDVKGTNTTWCHSGRLTCDPLGGVVGVTPATEGGLVVATPSRLLCFAMGEALRGREPVERVLMGHCIILSVAAHPTDARNPVVSLQDGGLKFMGPTSDQHGPEQEQRMLTGERSLEFAVDDEGLIFAGVRSQKTLWTLRPEDGYRSQDKTYKLGLAVAGLAAYGSGHVFVTDGKKLIQKHHCRRHGKRGSDSLKLESVKKIALDKGTAVRQIRVHCGLLYALYSATTASVRIAQYDVETCEVLQTFDGQLGPTRGMGFFDRHKVALYSAERVDVFEAVPGHAEDEEAKDDKAAASVHAPEDDGAGASETV